MLRLMSYNILDGGLGRVDPLAEVVRHVNPDLLACVEADLEENFNQLAWRLEMRNFYWARGLGSHPLGVMSKLPLSSLADRSEAPSGRTCAEVDVRLPSGQSLRVFAVHLTPHCTLERENQRVEEVRYLLGLAEPMRQAGEPHVFLGDFNATHPSQVLDVATMRENDRKRVTAQGGLVPRHAVELVLQAGYVDAYSARHGDEPGLTLTTAQPSLRVDYIFLSPDLAARLKDADVHHERLATYASDHFPIWADLDI